MLYYERCEKARMRIPLKVPKENRRIYPVSEELKAYGRKKPNGGKPGFVVYYTNYSLMASSHIEGIRCVNAEDSVFLERSYV